MSYCIVTGERSRATILRGVNDLVGAVRVTLGPRGRSVALESKVGGPLITKDGVTVANDIALLDPLENMGAEMVREVASKTNRDAGDGTTTAILLAHAIFREGVKVVAAGANPTAVKKGIEKAVRAAVEHIQKMATMPRLEMPDVESEIAKLTKTLPTLKEILTEETVPPEKIGKFIALNSDLKKTKSLQLLSRLLVVGHKIGLADALADRIANRVVRAQTQLVQSLASSFRNQLLEVATTSANNDKQIGAIVAEAMNKVGKDGVVTLEESKTTETSVAVVEGMQFDRGYLSPYFVTDPERMECVLEDVRILLHEKKISSMKELIPLLEQIAKTGKPLLILSEDVEGEALATLVVNKLRGTLGCAAVKAPGFGDHRKEMLEDIAILVGGKVFAEDLGIKLEDVKLDNLGRAKKVTISKDATTIVEGAGEAGEIERRIRQIRAQIEATESDYDKEKLQQRLAKLVGGIAVIKIGAATEMELKERKSRAEDALHAARAAVAEGIVPGGGVALVRCIPAVDRLKLVGDEATGVDIIRRALEAPMRQIIHNAGYETHVIVNRVRASKDDGFGFNVETNEYCDLITAGVIDPAKVTRLALQNAASIAGLMLLTETLISGVREREAKAEAAKDEHASQQAAGA